MKNKLTSRKFWLSVAAFLGSLGGSVVGFQNGMENLAITGLICAALSAAIYSACEATVDKSNVKLIDEEE